MKRPNQTTVEVQADGITRRVTGAIEAWNCADVVEQLSALDGPRTLVDLAGVKEVDSTGLGALIDIHQRSKRLGHQLAFSNPSPAVRRLLETTRLLRFFTILEDPASIAQFLAPEPATD
ncbi:MAG: STAS domain-containing protein [bacterium]